MGFYAYVRAYTPTATGPVGVMPPAGSVRVVAFGEAATLLRGRPAEFRHRGLSLTSRRSAIDALLELGREPSSIALVPTDSTDIPAGRIIELARSLTKMPVIVGVAAGAADKDVSELFDCGATATVALPVTPQRLADAIAATVVTESAGAEPIVVGALALDDAVHRIEWHERDIPLAPKSYALVRHLMHAHPRIVGLDELTAAEWNHATQRAAPIHSAIRRARAAFKAAVPRHPVPIETIHRVGYRLRA